MEQKPGFIGRNVNYVGGTALATVVVPVMKAHSLWSTAPGTLFFMSVIIAVLATCQFDYGANNTDQTWYWCTDVGLFWVISVLMFVRLVYYYATKINNHTRHNSKAPPTTG